MASDGTPTEAPTSSEARQETDAPQTAYPAPARFPIDSNERAMAFSAVDFPVPAGAKMLTRRRPDVAAKTTFVCSSERPFRRQR